MQLNDEHIEELRQAKFLLENPSAAAKFSNVLAQPVEKGLKLLPDGARQQILAISEASLSGALKLALYTLGDEIQESSDLSHKAGAALAGAAGGAFGLSALAAELPGSTAIMLRSIADIAIGGISYRGSGRSGSWRWRKSGCWSSLWCWGGRDWRRRCHCWQSNSRWCSRRWYSRG